MIVKFKKKTASNEVKGGYKKDQIADVLFANGQTWLNSGHAEKVTKSEAEAFVKKNSPDSEEETEFKPE